MAVTMMVFYKEPPDREKFDKYYNEVHMPLVHKLPGLRNVEMSRFTGKDVPYYLLTTLYFADKEARKAALASPEGKVVTDDVVNFASPEIMTVSFADII
jgi:uncharacterized protein (TIGR02118 family)